MIVTEVTRSYSRSINTRNYGAAESWVKIESTYTAQIESGDDPIKVSADLYAQCQSEVATGIAELVSKIKQSTATPAVPGTPAPAPAPAAAGPTPL